MEFILPDFTLVGVWMSLLTLTFLEIVLGIDNIIFISIAAGKLPESERPRATNIGLILAMGMRIALLFGISVLVAMKAPWFYIGDSDSLIRGGFSGQSLILIAGGLFLLYKSTTEIHHKLEGSQHGGDLSAQKRNKQVTLSNAILQITLINIVFSFDSILTAVGMTSGLTGAMVIMVIAVVVSVLIMMLFAVPVGSFVNKHPTIQMLGLAFLILIGFMLIAEGAHLAHLSIADTEIGVVPKGYLYFAIAFSLFVEFLNLRLRRRPAEPVQLHGIQQQAKEEGIL
ncbi:MAG TPA: TerC family protein [Saprospiraceae bacterium]|nr:TerC family protein [Saprospiraceae bacterium]HMP25305.1 TerC family protein [Saprospiraceae bacterium]